MSHGTSNEDCPYPYDSASNEDHFKAKAQAWDNLMLFLEDRGFLVLRNDIEPGFTTMQYFDLAGSSDSVSAIVPECLVVQANKRLKA